MGTACEPSVCLRLEKKILKEEYVRLAKCLGCLKSSLWPLASDWRQLIGTKSSWHLGHEDDKKITWTIPMVQWEWIRRCFSICEGWWGEGSGPGLIHGDWSSRRIYESVEGRLVLGSCAWALEGNCLAWNPTATASWPWANHLTMLCLGFSTCKMGIWQNLRHKAAGKIKGCICRMRAASRVGRSLGNSTCKGTARAPEFYSESQLSSLPGPVIRGQATSSRSLCLKWYWWSLPPVTSVRTREEITYSLRPSTGVPPASLSSLIPFSLPPDSSLHWSLQRREPFLPPGLCSCWPFRAWAVRSPATSFPSPRPPDRLGNVHPHSLHQGPSQHPVWSFMWFSTICHGQFT